MNKLVSLIAAFFLIAAPAYAQSASEIVETAKIEGVVGERPDGYLGIIPASVEQSVIDAVDEINIKRRAVYTRLAREEGVTVEIVARLTAEELIQDRLEPGEFYMTEDGSWVQKD